MDRNATIRGLMLTALMLLSGNAACGPAPDSAKEYKYKLAFLYKFAQYVENAVPVAAGQVRIGVFGSNPFGSTLQLVAAKRPRNLKCVTVIIPSLKEFQATDILFVTRGVSAADLQMLQKRTSEDSILLVGEQPGFLQSGGVINFAIGSDGRIKLHLNASAAQKRKLKIDARLLKICQITDH